MQRSDPGAVRCVQEVPYALPWAGAQQKGYHVHIYLLFNHRTSHSLTSSLGASVVGTSVWGVRFGRGYQIHGLAVKVGRVRFLGVCTIYVFPVSVGGVRFGRVHQVHSPGV